MKRISGAALLVLSACGTGEVPQATGAQSALGDTEDTTPFSGIAEDAVLRFTGTEPFWGGVVADGRLTWTTPENIDGVTIAVTRFAGRAGLSFSGTLEGQGFDLAVTPGECSDGMSDRTYPFTATVKLGTQQLNGCAWREGDDLGGPA
jgi:uncharacterized membrane protein